MAAPTAKTNLELIMDCIGHRFSRISHQNSYRTNGIVVDRDKDPRIIRQNKPDLYRQHHAAVTVSLGKRTQDPKITGGRIRWMQQFTLMGLRTLTVEEDAAGRTLDGLVSDMQDDLFRALQSDRQFKQAAEQLGLAAPPNITALNIPEWDNDEGANFPDAHFVGIGTFIYDEWL